MQETNRDWSRGSIEAYRSSTHNALHDPLEDQSGGHVTLAEDNVLNQPFR